MLGYAVRRILWIFPVLLMASVITFLMMHAAPGSPWSREGRQLDPVVIERLNEQLGLDQPLPMQYLAWLGRIAVGDFGLSVSEHPLQVRGVIGNSALPSLQLGLMAFGLALIVGLPLGIVAALRHRTVIDYAATGVAILGMAAPAFVLGALFQLVFTARDFGPPGLLPRHGWDSPQHWILPTIALAGLPMAQIARFTKASMLEVIHADYIRVAHSKGLDERWIVTRHMIRNALVPLVTIAGPILAILVTGSIAVELIFDIPGLGQLYWGSIRYRDYGAVMGITVLYAGSIALLNAVVDIAYGYIDPRIRDGSREPA